MSTPLQNQRHVHHFDSRTYIKAKIEGTMTVQALSLYLSENNPDATTQSDAKMYGGALRPWASAAVKPMFFTMVGSDSENPYSAMVLQMATKARIQVCVDWTSTQLEL
jgi:hypothetical protein